MARVARRAIGAFLGIALMTAYIPPTEDMRANAALLLLSAFAGQRWLIWLEEPSDG